MKILEDATQRIVYYGGKASERFELVKQAAAREATQDAYNHAGYVLGAKIQADKQYNDVKRVKPILEERYPSTGNTAETRKRVDKLVATSKEAGDAEHAIGRRAYWPFREHAVRCMAEEEGRHYRCVVSVCGDYRCFRLTECGSGGDALRRRWLPVPGQQFGEPVDRMAADARDDVREPSFRFDAVQSRRSNERVECGSALTTRI